MAERGRDWCILRTSGQRTLALAASLTQAGFDVWTPMQTATRRRGRTRERVEYDAPVMPTFVFARADRVADLAAIAAAPVSPHPPFSLFRYLGRIPLIGDAEVAGARRVEDRSKRAAVMGQRKAFTAGQRVRVSDGPGTGLCGNVVQDADGKFIMVAFGDATFKIGSWLLGPVEVQETLIAA